MPDRSPRPARLAVVTGGTAGVGRATVRRLAARGWDVAVLARGQERLDDTVAEVRAAGRGALGISVDVADAAAVDAAADRIEDQLGPVQAWINNAFTGAIAFFPDLTAEEFERITAVTYLGYVNGTRAALRLMTPRDAGTIVQVGSALAHRGIPLQAPYCGAKHAIKGFTEAVRVETMHRKLDIAICEVDLPAVNTPQFDWVLHRGISHHPMPVEPIWQPELVARAIVRTAERPRRDVWVGAPTARIILANRLVPGLLDLYLARTNIEAQQSSAHDPLPREANTWDPVYGSEIAARGSFDDKALSRSATVALTRSRVAAAALVCLAGELVRRGRR